MNGMITVAKNSNNIDFIKYSLYITFFYYLCIEIQHQGVE